MSAVNDLVSIMREEGAYNNAPDMTLGVMTSPTSCKVGELVLSGSDLLVAGHLVKPICTKVNVVGDNNTDNSTYTEPLKSGDTVLVKRMSDSQYVIIERLVQL